MIERFKPADTETGVKIVFINIVKEGIGWISKGKIAWRN